MTDRHAIADRHGIPALADRLRGETEEELTADAERLAKALGVKVKTTVAEAQARYRQRREDAESRPDPFAGMKVIR